MRHKRRRQNVNMWRTADENRQPRLREAARWRSYCGRTALHAWLWIKHDSLYRFAVPPNVYTKKRDLCLYIVYNNTVPWLMVWNMGGMEPPSSMLGNGEDNILKKGQRIANPPAHWSVLGLLPFHFAQINYDLITMNLKKYYNNKSANWEPSVPDWYILPFTVTVFHLVRCNFV